ncbi:glucose dehydrogenase [FAD, quinone]-like [Stomoxys calcitrans]|uniref:Glucose-methanol-choline oxidoreductase N-terminal domain-containing protein n=1 Tax=Stomoxys calcitrans TaxID=35570 RepID=A0A1I8PH17_STOCA|nr:glucose dehydrogenase [FAD, quinone]-like [Stomoxys calcitrans]
MKASQPWTLLILLSLLGRHALGQTPNPSLFSVLWEFIQIGGVGESLEAMDNNVQLLKEYDFIIVGAGTAGCTLAARLSENPHWKILLLEAGGPESLILDIPVVAQMLKLNPDINWGYATEPSDKYCLGVNNRRCLFPRGKVMGGSSVLNAMMYTRGNRRDYDNWARMGNEGWSYEEVKPYFKKLEGSLVPDAEPEFVGRKGPVKVTYPTRRSQLVKAFVKAGQEDGLPLCDYNGKRQTCISYIQTTTNGGYRWSANRAYLYPIKGKRPNLHIKKRAFVTKILIEPKTKAAYGVAFESGGKSYQIRARREVISSAGAINSPQLLMLSGIGPAKHLREVGIKPLADLAVGFNLQDHIAPVLSFLTNTTTLKTEQFFDVNELLLLHTQNSTLSIPDGIEGIAFYDLDHPTESDGWPDMELFLISGGLDANPATVRALGMRYDIYHALYDDILDYEVNKFLIFPMMLQPRSRGRIMLSSKDPKTYPLIYPNYFHDPYDLDITVRGLQKSLDLMNYPAMRKINAQVLAKPIPECQKYGAINSRPYLECYARFFTFTIFHQSGTVKMGPKWDRQAVVDPRLRVYGIEKLRVVDASIMPKIIAGHPNGPTYMIAEKAADMIKQDYGYL